MKEDTEECYLCGKKDISTRDHIPPKGLFLSPAPSNLITVPSCESCNKSYELDDEYLRVFLSSRPNRNTIAKQIWDEKVVGKTFRRSPKLREVLSRTIRTSELHTPAGIYIGKLYSVDWLGKRLRREFERIVRGLYLHEMGLRLPSGLRFDFWDQSDFNIQNEIIHVYATATERTIGTGEVFVYRYHVAPDDLSLGIWWLLFYRSTIVCGIHEHSANLEEAIGQ
ncbi:MAG: hypothetical protein A2Z27_01065 [candidate division Zixibacteria bacterium RBG_16_50_21]|nr:MAG: hypothetical protein A2Z27_01065 [candidate division Zixibacteria bacterium RBG_16_50_21]